MAKKILQEGFFKKKYYDEDIFANIYYKEIKYLNIMFAENADFERNRLIGSFFENFITNLENDVNIQKN